MLLQVVSGGPRADAGLVTQLQNHTVYQLCGRVTILLRVRRNAIAPQLCGWQTDYHMVSSRGRLSHLLAHEGQVFEFVRLQVHVEAVDTEVLQVCKCPASVQAVDESERSRPVASRTRGQ